jgi:two-component system chemotaxis sensor kinase CheA
LRNAVDHGVEPPEARERAGKPARGTVTLRAEYSSGGVSISVSDDGAGMDPQRVLAKARERGLVGPGEELSDTEALNLLFEAGFSTAEQVTDVSGRGVGMDVVKRGIDALRGKIDIDSTPGKGSEIRIRLPLTLAIIDGLHVTVGGESFIIPLAAVEACQERFLTDGGPVKELDVVERRGRMVPCLSLRRLLDVPGEQPDYERVVVAGVDGQTVGLAVDCVVGRQQAVIKSLGEAYKDLDWFSGTTINGSGSVSLILDVAQVVRHAAKLEGRNQGGLV